MLKFKSKISFAHIWHISLWLSATHHISFLINRFVVKYRFISPSLRFIVKSPSVTQDRKRAKTRRFFFFFLQNYRLKKFLYSNWKQFQVFKIAKFEFKVTVHYSLWAKCTKLWPLNCVIVASCLKSKLILFVSSSFKPVRYIILLFKPITPWVSLSYWLSDQCHKLVSSYCIHYRLTTGKKLN